MKTTVDYYEFENELKKRNQELKEFVNKVNPKFAQIFGGIRIESTWHDSDSDDIGRVAVSCCSFGELTPKEAVELSTILVFASSLAMNFKYNGYKVTFLIKNT